MDFTLLANFLDRYGFPLIVLASLGYASYKWIIPMFAEQWKRQQDFLFAEIARLNSVTQDQSNKMIDAFKQNSETSTRVQTALETMAREIAETRKETDERLTSVQKDVSEIYRIVGTNRNLLRREEDKG